MRHARKARIAPWHCWSHWPGLPRTTSSSAQRAASPSQAEAHKCRRHNRHALCRQQARAERPTRSQSPPLPRSPAQPSTRHAAPWAAWHWKNGVSVTTAAAVRGPRPAPVAGWMHKLRVARPSACACDRRNCVARAGCCSQPQHGKHQRPEHRAWGRRCGKRARVCRWRRVQTIAHSACSAEVAGRDGGTVGGTSGWCSTLTRSPRACRQRHLRPTSGSLVRPAVAAAAAVLKQSAPVAPLMLELVHDHCGLMQQFLKCSVSGVAAVCCQLSAPQVPLQTILRMPS